MRDAPREILNRLVDERGPNLLDDSRLCESLLRDLCPEDDDAIHLIISGLGIGAATRLRSSVSSAQPTQIVIHQLVQQLKQKRHMAEYAARWAVETIALALKVISPNELTLIEESWHVADETPSVPAAPVRQVSRPAGVPPPPDAPPPILQSLAPQSLASQSTGSTQKVETYLTQAILVTLCCCLPGGIVGIVYASRAKACLETGDVAGARKAAATAKGWLAVATVLGLLAWSFFMMGLISGV